MYFILLCSFPTKEITKISSTRGTVVTGASPLPCPCYGIRRTTGKGAKVEKKRFAALHSTDVILSQVQKKLRTFWFLFAFSQKWASHVFVMWRWPPAALQAHNRSVIHLPRFFFLIPSAFHLLRSLVFFFLFLAWCTARDTHVLTNATPIPFLLLRVRLSLWVKCASQQTSNAAVFTLLFPVDDTRIQTRKRKPPIFLEPACCALLDTYSQALRQQLSFSLELLRRL